MHKLDKAVEQLSKSDYISVFHEIQNAKFFKELALFALLREGLLSDKQIKGILKISDSAYTTLKSRLYIKVKQYLVVKYGNPNAPSKKNRSS